ncbi:MAG: hypothetical protein M0R17_09480 [Candidatus Omnitrophica bacterium]|jgi:predicted Zn-ribbon and HTH transcriptional regulator|nr:hypothetical protein [Candidatus Omnitrophota bacterium]
MVKNELINECCKCGHRWKRRNKKVIPKICPICKSKKWNRENNNRINDIIKVIIGR